MPRFSPSPWWCCGLKWPRLPWERRPAHVRAGQAGTAAPRSLSQPHHAHALRLSSPPTASEETGHTEGRQPPSPQCLGGRPAGTRVSVLARFLPASLKGQPALGTQSRRGAVPRGQRAGGGRARSPPGPHRPCLGGVSVYGGRGQAGRGTKRLCREPRPAGREPSRKMWLRLSRPRRGRRARRMGLCVCGSPSEPRGARAPACVPPPGAFQKRGLLRGGGLAGWGAGEAGGPGDREFQGWGLGAGSRRPLLGRLSGCRLGRPTEKELDRGGDGGMTAGSPAAQGALDPRPGPLRTCDVIRKSHTGL